jgi:hypothetical protein
MIPVGILTAASGSGFDPAAQDFFNRVTASGCSLTLTEKNAVNTLTLSLKAANIWNSLKVIYPMVGACGGACAQNLKSSSFTGSFSLGGWTFASTGATPNGFSAFMETFFNYRTETTGFSQHISMYSRTQNTTGQTDIGAYDGSAECTMWQYFGPISLKGGSIYTYPITALAINNSNTKGFQINTRTANNVAKLYFNNSLLITNTNTETLARPNISVYIGASHWLTGATQFASHENAYTSLGDGLTDTQASDYYTIIQAFQTTLGRQV